MSAILEQPKLAYPESDGKPMAETGIHVRAIELLHQALDDFFADRPDVFIAADMFWYFEEGVVQATAPDVMVVPGVGNHERRSFFTWEENGAVPAVVFEMASKGTVSEDLNKKFYLYEARGVREYFIFDPEAKYLRPFLQGFRLNGAGVYQRLKAAERSLASELGFRVRREGTMLRLIDAKTNLPVPTRSERADAEMHRADAEQRRADAEQQRADAEHRRADALALEIERLKALLAQAGGSPNGNGA